VIVGQTILRPGESTEIYTDIVMPAGMGGPHLFEISVTTNDPTQPVKRLLVATDWQPD
jgi:hypothetical protein